MALLTGEAVRSIHKLPEDSSIYADVRIDDELGQMGLDQRGAELLSQVATEREDKLHRDSFRRGLSGWSSPFIHPGLARGADTGRQSGLGSPVERSTSDRRATSRGLVLRGNRNVETFYRRSRQVPATDGRRF
jgi:hypothetical protein